MSNSSKMSKQMGRMTLFSKIIVVFIGFHVLFYFWGESVLFFKHLNGKFINTFVVYVYLIVSSSCKEFLSL